MTRDLHITDDLIQELESIALRTGTGSFVDLEDIRRLQNELKNAQQEASATALTAPKTIGQARVAAKEYLTSNNLLAPDALREPGRSTPATDQTLSRA